MRVQTSGVQHMFQTIDHTLDFWSFKLKQSNKTLPKEHNISTTFADFEYIFLFDFPFFVPFY